MRTWTRVTMVAGSLLVALIWHTFVRDAARVSEAQSGSSSSLRGQTLVIADYGGTIQAASQKHFYGPFSDEAGVQVKAVPVGTGPAAQALLQAESGNVQWDVINQDSIAVLELKGYLEPFPQDLYDELVRLSRPDAVSKFSLSAGDTAALIACNPAIVQEMSAEPEGVLRRQRLSWNSGHCQPGGHGNSVCAFWRTA
jgi:hypothetical protein